ncbi:MAG: transglycosylase SLT domain-containing protein [Myxococcaceae bacterium]
MLVSSLSAAALALLVAQAEPDESAGIDETQLEALLESTETTVAQTPSLLTEESFKPYFSEAEAALAKRAFDRGDYARAREGFSAGDLPSRYMAALAALRLGLPEAAPELVRLADEYPAVRDRCLLDAGRATERQRKPLAAAALYAAVSPSASVFAEARFAMADVLERNQRYGEAVLALEPLRQLAPGRKNDVVRRQAMMRVIALERIRRDFPAEYRAMVELWATSPKSAEAARLWRRLGSQPLPNPWRLRRAESFLAFHEHNEAERLARQVRVQPPHSDGCRARYVLGTVLRKERKHRAAIEMLAPLVDSCSEPTLRAQTLYVLGYSQSVVDKPAAIATYTALANEFPEHALADDALFFAAELHAREGDVAQALIALDTLTSRYATGNFAAQGLFKKAWLQKRLGKNIEAIATLETLEHSRNANQHDVSRATYWRARLLETASPTVSEKLFQGLVHEHPTRWYGLLAREQLGADHPASLASWANAEATDPLSPLDVRELANHPQFISGVELLRLGLRQATQVFASIDTRTLGEEPTRWIAHLMDRARNPHAQVRPAQAAWRGRYPLAYRPLVEKHSRKAKLDPDLFQALMREESSFNRRARSSTGAIGLSQLMPQTARAVARQLSLGQVNEALLMDPAINIRLGSAYLASLVSEFDSLPYAVAAYNAGPGRVRQWAAQRGDTALDAWVEEIPFEETRHYVMRVLGSYGAYRQVSERADGLKLEALKAMGSLQRPSSQTSL